MATYVVDNGNNLHPGIYPNSDLYNTHINKEGEEGKHFWRLKFLTAAACLLN